MKPEVSIILPAYNACEFLTQAVESVLTQTFPNWELLIIDDGSTDNTAELAQRLAGEDPEGRIRIFSKPNGGLSDARNYGIGYAVGNFLFFLDADDMIHPQALEILLNIQGTTGSEIVIAGYLKFHNEPEIKFYPFEGITYKTIDSEKAVKKGLYQSGIDHSAWGKLYSRHLFNAIKFTKGTWYEDMDLFYRLWLQCPEITYTSVPLYFYRQHPGSYLHTYSFRRADMLRVTERMEEWIAIHRPGLLWAARDRRMSANFNMLLLMVRNDVEDSATQKYCLGQIKRLRFRSLVNPRVRIKNKLGILISYTGWKLLKKTFRVLR